MPSCFIARKQDWGVYQKPGDFENMQTIACTQMRECHLVEGAGHWVQQERPEEVSRLLIQFLQEAASIAGSAAGIGLLSDKTPSKMLR